MNFRHTLVFAGLLCSIAVAQAQDLQSSFFLDNYAYSHRINPALQASRDDVAGYVGAAAGNIVLSGHSNVGVNNFLFPTADGELIIGLDDRVSSDEFLSGLSPVNSLRLGLNENLFSIGGKGRRGLAFNFEVNLKSNNSLNISKDVFELLKQGGNLNGMNFSDFSINSGNYLEAALGFGKKCGNLSIGFKVKALVGIAAAEVSVNEIGLKNSEGSFQVDGSGDIRVAAKPISLIDADGRFKSPSLGKIGNSGFGVAFDLGVAYFPIENLELSASVGDLGVMSWDYDINGKLNCSFSEELDIRVKDNKTESESGLLPVNFNIGARYGLNKTFSVGAVASARTGNQKTFEFRGGATCTPGSVLSLAVSGGINSFGPVYGAALNLCLGPVNLFAGVDQFITRFTPQWIPVGRINTNAALGLLVSW